MPKKRTRDNLMPLAGRHIMLGVSGGIAAYKSAELLRALVKNGAVVRVMMTANAIAIAGTARATHLHIPVGRLFSDGAAVSSATIYLASFC